MKKMFNAVRNNILPITGIFLSLLLFSACNKLDDDNGNTNPPVAGLMAFNLAPDKSSIGISLSGSNLTNVPLNYTNFTGVYQPIFPGSRQVEAFDFGGPTPFATATRNFTAEKYYSSFTVGANGVYANMVVEDELDTLSASSGDAFVRYVNAIPDSSDAIVTIASGTIDINANASYPSVSAFHAVNAGDLVIGAKIGTTVNANRTITIEKGKIYTILLVGIPGSTDPVKEVQIKFIQNGTLTP